MNMEKYQELKSKDDFYVSDPKRDISSLHVPSWYYDEDYR